MRTIHHGATLTGVLVSLASLFTAMGLLAASPALGVSTCGETVPAGGTGTLENDLVCAGPVAVYLDSGATLDMAGCSITLNGTDTIGIYCLRRRCTVLSSAGTPGEIAGTDAATQIGIYVNQGLPDPRVVRATLGNLFLHDLLDGLNAHETRVIATEVTANDCGSHGLHAKRLVAENVTANGNVLDGISARAGLRGVNITTNNNSYGIRTAPGRIRLVNFNATGNSVGMAVHSVTLIDSDVRGNTYYDIGGGARRPILINTLCDRSRDLRGGVPPGTTWGVCALD